MIPKFLVEKIIKLVLKQLDLDKISEYVFGENELDRKTEDLEKRVAALESKKK